MVKKYLNLLVPVAIVFLLIGCGGRNSSNSNSSGYDISIDAESTTLGATNLVVTVKDQSGTPINDATVNIKGDMTHAGMSPVLGQSSKADNGTYTVPYEWTMAGDWVVSVDVILSDGTVISEKIDFSGIGGDDGDMDHGDMDMESDDDMEMDHGEMDMGEDE